MNKYLVLYYPDSICGEGWIEIYNVSKGPAGICHNNEVYDIHKFALSRSNLEEGAFIGYNNQWQQVIEAEKIYEVHDIFFKNMKKHFKKKEN